MDTYPDPALVGKAFVKQYYTQMHRDPTQMHRFYLEQSSFVHGGSEMGSEEPVIGQKAIHDKILSLDLQQVHAKIKQVDSHATLGNGIVIQVTGELSTGGHPMRAFVQTFVLAPESPKKYYVHNDMFRYQDDDLVSESETDGPGESESLPAVELTSADEGEFPPAHNLEGALPESGKEEEGLYVGEEADLGGGAEQGLPEPTAEIGGAGGGVAWEQFEDPAGLTELQQNGIGGEEGREEERDTPTQQTPLQEYVDPVGHVTVAEVEAAAEQDGFPSNEPQEVEVLKGAGTWASRLTHGFPAGSTPKPVVAQVPRPRPISNSTAVTSQALPQRDQRPRRMDASSRGGPPTGKDSSRKAMSLVSPRDAPDTFQIFVGGLPTHTTEDDLKSVFNSYGTIIEVRVNPKNFAFIVFDNPDSVRKIISQKDQIHLRQKSLNIEPKRPSAPRSGGAGSRGKPLLNQGSGGGKPQRIGKVAKR